DAAVALYRKHLEKNPDDKIVLGRIVQLYFTMQKYAEVIPYAERLSDDEPDNLNLKVKLGILYTEGKDYRKAISVFKELLQHTPDNDNILYYVAAIYQQLEMNEQAIDYYSKISDKSDLYEDSSMQIAKLLASESERELQEQKKLGEVSRRFM